MLGIMVAALVCRVQKLVTSCSVASTTITCWAFVRVRSVSFVQYTVDVVRPVPLLTAVLFEHAGRRVPLPPTHSAFLRCVSRARCRDGKALPILFKDSTTTKGGGFR